MSRKEQPACETEQYTFPTMLRKLMKSTDTKQKELAQAIGMRPQTVSLYVQGQSFPDVNTLTKIADFFNVSADYLLGRTNVKTPQAEIQAVCEYTGLLEASIRQLHRRKHDPSYSQVLNTLIVHPEILEDFYLYLDLNIDSIAEISEENPEEPRIKKKYKQRIPLMDSKKERGVDVPVSSLKNVPLLQVIEDLIKLKQGMGGGNP